jgi:hypothetical protein
MEQKQDNQIQTPKIKSEAIIKRKRMSKTSFLSENVSINGKTLTNRKLISLGKKYLNKKIIKTKPKITKPPTIKQQDVREKIKTAKLEWSGMTKEQKSQYGNKFNQFIMKFFPKKQ